MKSTFFCCYFKVPRHATPCHAKCTASIMKFQFEIFVNDKTWPAFVGLLLVHCSYGGILWVFFCFLVILVKVFVITEKLISLEKVSWNCYVLLKRISIEFNKFIVIFRLKENKLLSFVIGKLALYANIYYYSAL